MGTNEVSTGANTTNVSNSDPQNVADGTSGTQDRKLAENSKQNLDEKQDHGLEETFPGSDPVSVKITK